MKSINVASVSYLNSYPFVFGLRNYKDAQGIFNLCLCKPAVCADVFSKNKADIAIIPIAALPYLNMSYSVITKYCIGAVNSVATVMLYSHIKIEDVDKIIVDSDSLTSYNLIKILADNYWHIKPDIQQQKITGKELFPKKTALLAIGDKCFQMGQRYAYTYDLFDMWHNLTGLPFVFAVWVANSKVDKKTLNLFEQALEYGINNKDLAVKLFIADNDIETDRKYFNYINQNISYDFDAKKKEAKDLFLKFMSKNMNVEGRSL